MRTVWPQSLTGRVAVITGAGKGLGRAYALDFARRGAKIVVNNRHRDPNQPASARHVAEEIRVLGGEAVANLDCVEDEQAGERLLALALERFGRLDILLNNAGVPEAKTLHKQSVAEFRAVFEVNFFGTLAVTLPIYKHMRATGYGRIIVSTSSAGLHGNHGMASYASSKAAIIGLARTIATEGAPHGIRCNALSPYATTGMTETYLDPQLKPRLDPAFVAPVAAWLASDGCTANGEIFVAGGGKVRRAAMVESHGIEAMPAGALTPELLAAHEAELRALAGAATYPHASAAFDQFLAAQDATRLFGDTETL